jgi:Mn2+/Fe2+ NRAMP family transporter
MSLFFVGLGPIRALFWSAVINGVMAIPLMAMLMVMSANKAIVGKFLLPTDLRVLGWSATIVMFLASVAILVSGLGGIVVRSRRK